jgi:uncharacterized membrane protein (DUF373 family)
MRFGEINELAEKTGSTIIPADASNVNDLEEVFTKSIEILVFFEVFDSFIGYIEDQI